MDGFRRMKSFNLSEWALRHRSFVLYLMVLTLALGVLVSMFTAVVATRTFMRAALGGADESIRRYHWLLGI